VFERVVSALDPRVADYRGVSDPALLRARNLFVAEGRLVVSRLLEDTRWTVRSVLVSDAARQSLEPVLAAAAGRVPILVCGSTDFLGITGHLIHRGCLALVERPSPVPFGDLLTGRDLVVVLEGVGNPDNVGGVFRNAAAFGAGAVVLSPSCCSPLYRKAIRTSMGAVLRVPFVHLDEWPAPLVELRAAGFSIVAMTLREQSETIDAFIGRPRPAKLALVVGAEGTGLTAAAESFAEYRIRIPIEAAVDSLNLAVASGIALEQLTRDRRGRGILAARTASDLR
jgi:tRNA G18 (ribose-2'-O)-methylase SpoU